MSIARFLLSYDNSCVLMDEEFFTEQKKEEW